MQTNEGQFPIIIIGMHRSGTSMVSKLLEQLGVFVGFKKNQYFEALFFVYLNKKVLHSTNSTWSQPRALKEKLKDKEFQQTWINTLRNDLKTEEAGSFLGEEFHRKYVTPFNLPMLWGWKDPRNTFTLPLWLEIFPDAKIIHIYRHGVDVANSLKVRYDTSTLPSFKEHRLKRVLSAPFKALKHLIQKGKLPSRADTKRYYYSYIKSMDPMDLENGLSLWEIYMKESLQHVTNLGQKAVNIKYEDFLENPEQNLEKLVKFCGVKTTKAQIRRVAGMVNKSRRYAYRKYPELVTFTEQNRKRLANHGY